MSGGATVTPLPAPLTADANLTRRQTGMKALDKVKMPARAEEEDAMLELENEDLMEFDMEEADAEDMEASPLADLSDDELLAEVKARGLKLDDMEDEEGSAELELEMDMEEEA